MRRVLIGAVLVLAALAQVTVAPLFPLSAAIVDFPLAALVMLFVFDGPRGVMLALPAAALLVGFASDRSPALLLVAYLPLVPLGAYLAGTPLPMNRYTQMAITGVAAGLGARTVLVLAAVAHGAEPGMLALVRQVLFPGALLDLALLSSLYVPFRLVGWQPQRISLQRGGFPG